MHNFQHHNLNNISVNFLNLDYNLSAHADN